MKFAVVALCALFIGGCQQVSEMSYADYKALAIQKNKDCMAQGVKPGTKEMEICVIHEIRREDAARQSNQQRRMAAASAMQAASAGFYANAGTYAPAPTINCTSTGTSTFVGGAPRQINTTCR